MLSGTAAELETINVQTAEARSSFLMRMSIWSRYKGGEPIMDMRGEPMMYMKAWPFHD